MIWNRRERGRMAVEYTFDINDVEIIGVEDLGLGQGNEVTACYKGEQIANFYFDVWPHIDDDTKDVVLHYAYVREGYQHRGVGTKIMRTVAELYTIHAKNLCNNTVEDKNDIHYSKEGLSFIQKCVEEDIAKDDEAEVALEDVFRNEDE